MSRRYAALFLVGAALLAAGCGGSPGGKALQQEATSLQALAAEGSLLAHDASRGDTTSPFLRVHAGYLRKAASASAATARKAGAARLTALAGRLTDGLGRLSRSGSDRTEQRRLERELSALARQAETVGKSL